MTSAGFSLSYGVGVWHVARPTGYKEGQAMLRSLLAAVMTCALAFSFVGCAEEEPAEPATPKAPVVDTKKAAEKTEEAKKEGESLKKEGEKKVEEAKKEGKKLLEGIKK